MNLVSITIRTTTLEFVYSNIKTLSSQFIEELKSIHCKLDRDRSSKIGISIDNFCYLIIPLKKHIIPQKYKVMPLPFTATIIQNNKEYNMTYGNETMRIYFKI